eukprot:Trichotokara_eunicae@DN5326_c0_g1_i1.p1
MIFIQWRPVAVAMQTFARKTSIDYRAFFVSMLRGFPAAKDPLKKYRIRPSDGLLRGMAHRFNHWNQENFERDMRKIRTFTQRLNELTNVETPGSEGIATRTFWLFPFYAPKNMTPESTVAELFLNGIEASMVSTQLGVLKGEGDPNGAMTPIATRFMDRTYYLPVHRSATEAELELLLKVLGKLYN